MVQMVNLPSDGSSSKDDSRNMIAPSGLSENPPPDFFYNSSEKVNNKKK